MDVEHDSLYPFVRFSRGEWARLQEGLTVEEATDLAMRVWDEIDHPNLEQNIEPTRDRARLVLEKGEDHSVQSVRLRKI